MAKAIIDAVCKAEEEARKIKAEASEAAAELIQTGKREAADALSGAKVAAEKEAEEIVTKAKQAAEQILSEECKDDDYLALKELIKSKALKTAQGLKELI